MVRRGLLEDLTGQGRKTDRGLLVVIDGSKALRRAVADLFGNDIPVKRCQVHKLRNVLEHLPEETVTINRVMLSAALRRTLRSTNPIESAIEIAKITAHRVKRRQNGEQVQRWTAAGFKKAETRLRRVVGYYRELMLLRRTCQGRHSTSARAMRRTRET